MRAEITPDKIAAAEAALERHLKNIKSDVYDEPYFKTAQESESVRELRRYLSNEKNADDFAFSGWCAAQRGAWQKQRDLERAEMKREKESAKRIDT